MTSLDSARVELRNRSDQLAIQEQGLNLIPDRAIEEDEHSRKMADVLEPATALLQVIPYVGHSPLNPAIKKRKEISDDRTN